MIHLQLISHQLLSRSIQLNFSVDRRYANVLYNILPEHIKYRTSYCNDHRLNDNLLLLSLCKQLKESIPYKSFLSVLSIHYWSTIYSSDVEDVQYVLATDLYWTGTSLKNVTLPSPCQCLHFLPLGPFHSHFPVKSSYRSIYNYFITLALINRQWMYLSCHIILISTRFL